MQLFARVRGLHGQHRGFIFFDVLVLADAHHVPDNPALGIAVPAVRAGLGVALLEPLFRDQRFSEPVHGVRPVRLVPVNHAGQVIGYAVDADFLQVRPWINDPRNDTQPADAAARGALNGPVVGNRGPRAVFNVPDDPIQRLGHVNVSAAVCRHAVDAGLVHAGRVDDLDDVLIRPVQRQAWAALAGRQGVSVPLFGLDRVAESQVIQHPAPVVLPEVADVRVALFGAL